MEEKIRMNELERKSYIISFQFELCKCKIEELQKKICINENIIHQTQLKIDKIKLKIPNKSKSIVVYEEQPLSHEKDLNQYHIIKENFIDDIVKLENIERDSINFYLNEMEIYFLLALEKALDENFTWLLSSENYAQFIAEGAFLICCKKILRAENDIFKDSDDKFTSYINNSFHSLLAILRKISEDLWQIVTFSMEKNRVGEAICSSFFKMDTTSKLKSCIKRMNGKFESIKLYAYSKKEIDRLLSIFKDFNLDSKEGFNDMFKLWHQSILRRVEVRKNLAEIIDRRIVDAISKVECSDESEMDFYLKISDDLKSEVEEEYQKTKGYSSPIISKENIFDDEGQKYSNFWQEQNLNELQKENQLLIENLQNFRLEMDHLKSNLHELEECKLKSELKAKQLNRNNEKNKHIAEGVNSQTCKFM